MTTEDDPCLRLCVLSECTTYCVSCGRTTEQIREWYEMKEKKKLEALIEAQKRKKELGPIVYDG